MTQLSIAQFTDKLAEIMPVVMKEFGRRIIDGLENKVTLPQVLILEFLERQQESKMKDLAGFMGVSTAASTGIVDRLVKCGYVVRAFDPEDRRVIKIRLTPKGFGLLKQINLQKHRMVMGVFGKVSEEDRRDYLRILTQIKDILLSNGNHQEKGSHV